MKNKQYSWKITLKKFGINAIVVIIVGVTTVYANNPWILAALPMIKALENYLKHR